MVVHPQSTEDVAKIVKIAIKYRMPITPYSGGSSLEGNFRAVRVIPSSPGFCNCRAPSRHLQHPVGGICVDMSGMDKILEIHGMESKRESDVHGLTTPTRGRFGPCLSSRSSVDGCKRGAERERSVRVALMMSATKT